jgi:hypothetical protein
VDEVDELDSRLEVSVPTRGNGRIRGRELHTNLMEDLVNLVMTVTNLDLSLRFEFFKDGREREGVSERLKCVETVVVALEQQGREVSATAELSFF